jgi:hypothetical protein
MSSIEGKRSAMTGNEIRTRSDDWIWESSTSQADFDECRLLYEKRRTVYVSVL